MRKEASDLLALYMTGRYSIADLAVKYNRSEGTIRNRLKQAIESQEGVRDAA
jgi:hypothetical protein